MMRLAFVSEDGFKGRGYPRPWIVSAKPGVGTFSNARRIQEGGTPV